MNIVVIGAGNLAHYFCTALTGNQQFSIIQVYARNPVQAQYFEKKFRLSVTRSPENIIQDADIYLFAVNDGAIEELATLIQRPKALNIHCAGSQATELTAASGKNNAVIWPIYSITKSTHPAKENIPLIVDGNNAAAVKTALELASEISENVRVLNFEQRRYLHLNAVLVNNFTNHLMAIAEQVSKEQQIDFDILMPIIEQTAQRVKKQSPGENQTGPAKRKDRTTMQAQLELLAQHPEWQEVYRSLSASIIEMYPE